MLILLCLLIGWALRRAGKLPDPGPALLAGVSVYVFLPALTFVEVHRIEWRPELIWVVSVAWITFALTWSLVETLGRTLQFDLGGRPIFAILAKNWAILDQILG